MLVDLCVGFCGFVRLFVVCLFVVLVFFAFAFVFVFDGLFVLGMLDFVMIVRFLILVFHPNNLDLIAFLMS